MNIHTILPLSLLLLTSAASQGTDPASDRREIDPRDREIAHLAEQLAERNGVPGVALACIRSGAMVFSKGIGIANTKTRKPVTADTVFNVGSVSKSIAAWGFMQLVESGDVDLDAPIAKALTRWKLPDSKFDASGVTLRRMLSHTAGLSLHGYPGFADPAELPTLEQSLAGATGRGGDADQSVRLIHAPGSKWQYSGGGFTVAQLMLEQRTEQKFADYMREQVLAPLGMKRPD